MSHTHHLLHLLTLASSNLPIGTYCYSQGVESAIELGLIYDEPSCLAFLQDSLTLVLTNYELPMLHKLLQADKPTFINLAKSYLASRETKELLLETQQLAHAFNAWVTEVLQLTDYLPNNLTPKQLGFLPLFAQVSKHLQLPTHEVLTAYGFSQLENQVLAVVKTLPLGQMAGQRVLWQLQNELGNAIVNVLANKVPISASLPNLAILSSQHEVQYSRLFRS